MNSFEFNKMFGALVMAGLIAMLSGFTAGKIVSPQHLEENVYKVEGVVEASGTAAAPAAAVLEPVSALLKGADVAKGQASAKVCAACHDFTKGGPNKVGPNLYGIVGNVHAHAEGFAYSAAMKALHDKTWDYEALNAFLASPKTAVPGTKMAFAGFKNVQDRANVIAYLRSLADSPKPLP